MQKLPAVSLGGGVILTVVWLIQSCNHQPRFPARSLEGSGSSWGESFETLYEEGKQEVLKDLAPELDPDSLPASRFIDALLEAYLEDPRFHFKVIEGYLVVNIPKTELPQGNSPTILLVEENTGVREIMRTTDAGETLLAVYPLRSFSPGRHDFEIYAQPSSGEGEPVKLNLGGLRNFGENFQEALRAAIDESLRGALQEEQPR